MFYIDKESNMSKSWTYYMLNGSTEKGKISQGISRDMVRYEENVSKQGTSSKK